MWFGSFSGAWAEILADLAADYAAAESGFKIADQAVISTSTGSWTYSVWDGTNKTILTYGDVGDITPRAQGFRPEGAAQHFNDVSSQMLCGSDWNAMSPITTAMEKLNLHPSRNSNATVLEWSSESYYGPVRVTGFAQHAKTEGTGTNYTMSYQGYSGPFTSLNYAPISVRSSGEEFSAPLVYTPNSSLGMAFRANGGDYSNGTSYLGMQVEALPYLDSLAGSYVAPTGTGQPGVCGNWSYHKSSAVLTPEQTGTLLTSAVVGSSAVMGGSTMGYGGYTGSVSNAKMFSNTQDFHPATHLELHPTTDNNEKYLTVRWSRPIDIQGALHILGDVSATMFDARENGWDSVDFSIYGDGELLFEQKSTQAGIEEDTSYYLTPTSFYLTDVMADVIDFVVYAKGSASGDSTLLSAYILPTASTGVPEPGTLWLLGLGLAWLGRRLWKR